MDLNGKVAIVTGAARGIGLEYCKALLEKNVKVCLSDILTTEGEEATKHLAEKYGKGNVTFVKCDVTDEKQFENVFAACKTAFGGRIDILVNNAGIITETNWQKTIEVNLISAIKGIRLAFKHLGEKDDDTRGVIINTASLAGLIPCFLFPTYVATKHAIVGLTRSYGNEISFQHYRVKVNAICPGFVKTEMTAHMDIDPAGTPEAVEQFTSLFSFMSPDVPSKALIRILEEGKNGSCMLVESESQIKYVDFPTYIEMPEELTKI